MNSRKVLFIGVICFLLGSMFPNFSYAEEGSLSDLVKYIEVIQDTDMYVDNQKVVGKLKTGTKLSIEKIQEGKAYFQWNENTAYINEGDSRLIASQDQLGFILADNKNEVIQDKFLTPGTTNVYSDQNADEIILTLSSGVEYPLNSIEGDYYRITIGNRYGYVKASDVELLSKAQNSKSSIDQGVSKLQSINNTSQSTSLTGEQQSQKSLAISSKTVTAFTPADHFFKLEDSDVSIYDNSSGSLKLVGFLKKGETYPRLADYGDWHQIKFGSGFGYVWKDSTVPTSNIGIKNINDSLPSTSHEFIPTENLTVYDNSSGNLVPFASLAKGTKYPIISDLGDWYKVDVAGRIGYVYKPATVRIFEASDQFFRVKENNVSIYDNSSGTLKHVGYLNKGQVYQRIADYGDWHQIKFGNNYGYIWKGSSEPSDGNSITNLNKGQTNISRSFTSNEVLTVYDNSTGSLIPFASLSERVKYPIISEMGDWYKVDVAGRIGYVYKPATIRQFETSDRFFQVNDNNVSVYDNSTGTLKHVGYLNKGEIYSRIADYGDWHQIKFGDGNGYVWKASTIPADNSSNENLDSSLLTSNRFFTPTSVLTVYDNSAGRLVPFATLSDGVQYPLLDDYGDWYQISLAGRIGYVYKQATKRVFVPSNSYFQVNEDHVGIYDNSTGALRLEGYLEKGEKYSRVADYGDWHQVKLGNRYGYVWKAATSVIDNFNVNNISNSETNKNITFKALQDLSVYDNSSGSLVPFGLIKKDETYSAISVNGDWVKIEVAGRIGFIYKGAVQIISGALTGKVIVLDAGHGGYDTGAIGSNYLEKTLNLNAVLEIASLLNQEGANVILTRNSDVFLTLGQRTDISNLNKADIFISVHHNSSTYQQSNGFETFYYTPWKEFQLATDIHQAIMDQISLQNRGVYFGDFHVIRENTQPAILLELGFISNVAEERIVATSDYEKRVARGVLNGLIKYFQNH